jgi:hypothetical protein
MARSGDGGDQVCQKTFGLAERDWDEAAAGVARGFKA